MTKRKKQGRISSTYINVGKRFTARVVVDGRGAKCTSDDPLEAARCAKEKAERG